MSTVTLMLISLICTRLWSPYYICDYPPRQELIEESYQYVLCDIHMGVWFKGVHWQDVYEIPSDAICELIVNASVSCIAATTIRAFRLRFMTIGLKSPRQSACRWVDH